MTRLPILTLAALSFAGAAGAEPAPKPDAERPAQSLGKDADCVEWTDGCIVCRKSPEGAIACSTPGIACVPEAPRCTAQSR